MKYVETRNSLLTFVDGAELIHLTVDGDEISCITKDFRVIDCCILLCEQRMFNNYIDTFLLNMLPLKLLPHRALNAFDGTLVCTLMGGARLYRGLDENNELCSFLISSTGQELDAGNTRHTEFKMLNEYFKMFFNKRKHLF